MIQNHSLANVQSAVFLMGFVWAPSGVSLGSRLEVSSSSCSPWCGCCLWEGRVWVQELTGPFWRADSSAATKSAEQRPAKEGAVTRAP